MFSLSNCESTFLVRGKRSPHWRHIFEGPQGTDGIQSYGMRASKGERYIAKKKVWRREKTV